MLSGVEDVAVDFGDQSQELLDGLQEKLQGLPEELSKIVSPNAPLLLHA